jgi:hypothetical protein
VAVKLDRIATGGGCPEAKVVLTLGRLRHLDQRQLGAAALHGHGCRPLGPVPAGLKKRKKMVRKSKEKNLIKI